MNRAQYTSNAANYPILTMSSTQQGVSRPGSDYAVGQTEVSTGA